MFNTLARGMRMKTGLGWIGCVLLGAVMNLAAAEDAAPANAPVPEKTSNQPASITVSGSEKAVDAATPDLPQIFSTIIVTATRSEKPVIEIPYTIDLLTADDIQNEHLSRTLPESLQEVPGIYVQKTGHGQGSPFIRGFTGYQTLLLIDGIRLNNSVFRAGPNQYWNTVDPYTVSRMEIIKGPTSVIYGSDAIGGTINVITASPRMDAKQIGPEAHVRYRYASAENSNTGRFRLSGLKSPDVGYVVGVTGQNFGNLEGGNSVGEQPYTGYNAYAVDAKAVYRINRRSTVTIAFQRDVINDAPRTHKTIYGLNWNSTTHGSEKRRQLDQLRDLTYIQYKTKMLRGFVNRITASLSYQLQTEERYRIKSDDTSERQGFDVGTVGAWVQLESETTAGRFTYGVEHYHDTVNSFKKKYDAAGALTSVAIQGPVGDDARYDMSGLFVQDDVAATDSLDLILGLRYNAISTKADRVEDPQTGNPMSVSGSWDALVGSARFMYHIGNTERYNVFGGISQGFRAPNLSDLTRLDTARSNEIETPAPGLDPEHFITYELGLKSAFRRVNAQAAVYYTDITSLIDRTPTGNIIGTDYEVTKKNSGNGYAVGIELEMRWRFVQNWTAFGTFSTMDGKLETYPTSSPDSVVEPLSRLMPTNGTLGLRYQPVGGWGNWHIEGLVIMADKQDKLSTRDKLDTDRIPPGGTPGYAVAVLRGGFRTSDDLTLSLALENLFNTDYRVHGSGVNAPGFNVIIGLEYKL